MSSHEKIIERIVLFNVKPNVDSSKAAAMVTGLNTCHSLNLSIYLSAGKLLGSHSPSLSFTHILHARFKTKTELDQYAVHPKHVHVVTENIRPIVDDVMVLDWVSSGPTVSPRPGWVMRVTFFKLNPNAGENGKARVLEWIENRLKTVEESSFGENFNHEKAKGFTIACIAVLPSRDDFEALDSNEELVKDLVESEIVFDYLIPSS